MTHTLTLATEKRLADFNHPWKMGLWLFWKLPAAFFMGVRVHEVTAQRSVATLPFMWRSQNPFRSIYFAAQCSAAELSTGVLATLAITAQNGRPISMLVSHIEADFTKKATSRIFFTCEQGDEIMEAVQRAVDSGVAQTLIAQSVGRTAAGETVCTMSVTWSFKAK